ncbi:MAG: YybH family protein [Woeseiaceae bacterium]
MQDATQADRALIEALHQRDVAATKSGDIDGLKSLMDPECVLFPPGGEAVAGPEYLEQIGQVSEDEAGAEIIELVQDWRELKVFGDLAYEQGVVRYAVRGPDDKIIRETQRLVRILRRQADGCWRVYRAMWHEPVSSS